jgi:hypothetical protein
MGSGLCSRENDRLQLRGSGGFSPRFPNIPPSELPYAGSTTDKHLPWPVTLRCVETLTSNRNSPGLEERRCVSEKQKQKYNSCVGHKRLFTGSLCKKNRHRRPLRESIRIDVNLVGLLARASLDRSNLPSASLHQWRARLDPLRLQWLGRSGVKPDSHTAPSHKFYTAWEGASQIRIIRMGSTRLSTEAFRKTMTATSSRRCTDRSMRPTAAPLTRRIRSWAA